MYLYFCMFHWFQWWPQSFPATASFFFLELTSFILCSGTVLFKVCCNFSLVPAYCVYNLHVSETASPPGAIREESEVVAQTLLSQSSVHGASFILWFLTVVQAESGPAQPMVLHSSPLSFYQGFPWDTFMSLHVYKWNLNFPAYV